MTGCSIQNTLFIVATIRSSLPEDEHSERERIGSTPFRDNHANRMCMGFGKTNLSSVTGF